MPHFTKDTSPLPSPMAEKKKERKIKEHADEIER